MKNIILTICLFPVLLCSCSQDVPTETLIKSISMDLMKDADDIFSSTTEKFDYIEKSKWTTSIQKLNPIKVYVNENGLFIKTNEGFVEETGVFIKKQNIEKEFKEDTDPGYTQIEDRIYFYKIKG